MLEKLCGLENTQIIIVTGERINWLDKFNDIVIINEVNADGVNNAVELANGFTKEMDLTNQCYPNRLAPIITKDLEGIIKFSGKFEKGICIVPSRRYDGTNILLRKPNLIIDTFYDNDSFYNHIKKTLEKKKSWSKYLIMRN